MLWKGPDPTGQYVLAGRLAPALHSRSWSASSPLVAGRRWGARAGAAAGFALAGDAAGLRPRPPGGARHVPEPLLDARAPGRRAVASARRGSSARWRSPAHVWALALLTKIHAWFLLPILGVWSFRPLAAAAGLAAMAIWALRRDQPVLARLALALVRLLGRTPGVLGHRRGAADDHGAVLRPGLRRSRRALALPLVLLRGDRAARLAASRRHGNRSRLEEPPRRPVPAAAGGHDRAVPGALQHAVPVYDGERLFLHVFPAWALLIGLGFGWLWNRYRTASSGRRVRIILAGFLLVQVYGRSSLHPFGLSYYNGLVGGLPGAERLGLELTYWNDAVDQVLLDRLAREGQAGRDGRAGADPLPEQGISDDQPCPGAGRHHPAGRAGRQRVPSGSSSRAARRTGGPRSRSGSRAGRGPAHRRAVATRRLAVGTLAFPTGLSPTAPVDRRPTPSVRRRDHAPTQARSRQVGQLDQRLAELAPFPLAAAPTIRRIFSE